MVEKHGDFNRAYQGFLIAPGLYCNYGRVIARFEEALLSTRYGWKIVEVRSHGEIFLCQVTKEIGNAKHG